MTFPLIATAKAKDLPKTVKSILSELLLDLKELNAITKQHGFRKDKSTCDAIYLFIKT